MSLSSHKGQILPLLNQVSPISQNTTFYANFNGTTIAKTLRGVIYPFGYTSSLEFDGASTYVSIGDRPELSFANDIFTIEFWMKASDTTSSIAVLGKRGSPWEYSIFGSLGNLTFAAWESGGSRVYYLTTTYDTNWTHFAWVCDGVNTYLYKNGVQVQTAEKSAGSMSDTTAPFEIGRGGDSGGIKYFRGCLSEVRIWNIARTKEQIIASMNAPLNGDEQGLVGYWKLNEGEGQLISDYSQIGNDGVLNGAFKWSQGRMVATIRNGEGRYGDAVAVESPTTNEVSIVNPKKEGNTTTPPPEPAPYSGTVVYAPNGDWRGFQFTPSNQSLSAGELYSVSVYVYIPIVGTAMFNLHLDSAEVEKVSKGNKTIQTSKPGWYRVSWDGLSEGEARSNVSFRIENHMKSNWTGGNNQCWMAHPQFERKKISTSYTPSQRPSGYLAYPKEVINPDEGTISFWLYGIASSSPNPVFSSGVDSRTGTFDFLIQEGVNPYLRVYDSNATPNSTQLRPNINIFGSWNHIVITWKAGQYLRFYANGVKLAESTSPVDWKSAYLNAATGFYIGSGIRSNPDILIDELRIDSVAATDSEILSWYVGGPYYNPYPIQ